MANPPGKCIFCGEQGLTREHVWPDWMRNYVPRLSANTLHTVSLSGSEFRGRMNRTGAMGSQRLKVVCGKCNNEWMSRLQNEAKPILIKLINDDWKSLEPIERQVLNRWAVMCTIVIEHAHPETAAIAFNERKNFSYAGEVPDGWHCWIGRYSGLKKEPSFWHSGGPPIDGESSGVQMTSFTFGRALFQTFSCSRRFSSVQIWLENQAPLMKLFPETRFIQQRPSGTVSDQMAANIANFLKQSLIVNRGKR